MRERAFDPIEFVGGEGLNGRSQRARIQRFAGGLEPSFRGIWGTFLCSSNDDIPTGQSINYCSGEFAADIWNISVDRALLYSTRSVTSQPCLGM